MPATTQASALNTQDSPSIPPNPSKKSLRPFFDQLKHATTRLDDILHDLDFSKDEAEHIIRSEKFHSHRNLRTALLRQQLQLVAQDNAQTAIQTLLNLTDSNHAAIARLAATQILSLAGISPEKTDRPRPIPNFAPSDLSDKNHASEVHHDPKPAVSDGGGQMEPPQKAALCDDPASASFPTAARPTFVFRNAAQDHSAPPLTVPPAVPTPAAPDPPEPTPANGSPHRIFRFLNLCLLAFLLFRLAPASSNPRSFPLAPLRLQYPGNLAFWAGGDFVSEPAAGADKPQQFIHSLSNGLTLVAERIPGVQSAAMNLLLRSGAATDPSGQGGSASILSDWILRGAGERDSRELTGYLDGLGVQRSAGAETTFLRFGASMLAKNLLAVIPVYADIVRRPRLPEEGFEPALDLALQQLDAIEDEPSQKLSLTLRERHYPYPFGRPSVGKREEVETLTAEKMRGTFSRGVGPAGAIFSVAGMFSWTDLVKTLEHAFGDWDSPTAEMPDEKPAPRGVFHVQQDTHQSQIGLAWDTVADANKDSILVQTSMNVLSGGMGARLFTEIREKQGLCYSVHAGYASLKKTGAIFGYAGTSPDRAQRTLDSFFVELRRMEKGVTAEEFERAKIGMKSRVIMQGESSGARAGALAYDFYHRGRTRTLDELRELIEGVTLDRVNAFLAANPVNAGGVTVVTVGPEALNVGNW